MATTYLDMEKRMSLARHLREIGLLIGKVDAWDAQRIPPEDIATRLNDRIAALVELRERIEARR